MRPVSHYDYLEEHLPAFFEAVGLDWERHRGIISAHGDKCYTYRYDWEQAGIPFDHGTAIYLLSYCAPFDMEVRETERGWISPKDWVIWNYKLYSKYLPPSILDQN